MPDPDRWMKNRALLMIARDLAVRPAGYWVAATVGSLTDAPQVPDYVTALAFGVAGKAVPPPTPTIREMLNEMAAAQGVECDFAGPDVLIRNRLGAERGPDLPLDSRGIVWTVVLAGRAALRESAELWMHPDLFCRFIATQDGDRLLTRKGAGFWLAGVRVRPDAEEEGAIYWMRPKACAVALLD